MKRTATDQFGDGSPLGSSQTHEYSQSPFWRSGRFVPNGHEVLAENHNTPKPPAEELQAPEAVSTWIRMKKACRTGTRPSICPTMPCSPGWHGWNSGQGRL